MQALDEKQLQLIIDSLLPLQRELLPRGADLLALMAEIEGQPATERGYAGISRCIGEQAALGVRQTLEALVYAFAVLRVYLTQSQPGVAGGESKPKAQATAMLAAIDLATRQAMDEFEKLLSKGALSPEQIAQIRKEIEELAAPGTAPAASPQAPGNPAAALAEADKVERELLAELEKLCVAAGIDPAQVKPELEKLKQPGPDQPPESTGDAKVQTTQPSPAQPQSTPTEQEVLAELERAEQTARSNLPELEKQLVDAGVDQSAINELMALLKSPG